jgi:uncharacterized protein YjbI with pentapeptide repeats
MRNGNLVGPGADLSAADLSGQNLTGLNMTGVILTGANLAGADLTGTVLAHEQSSGLRGTPAALPANWSLLGGYLFGPEADLHGVNLNDTTLTGVDVSGADLGNTQFIGANLANANLSGADLTNALIDRATLTSTNFHDANLTDANVSLSDLTGANLSGANLTYLGGSANLTSANLSGANVTNANFNSANLTKASLAGVTGLGQVTASNLDWQYITWSDTTCPDGSNSDRYLQGCFSSRDTTPPAVTVVSVANGHSYVFGTAPSAQCETTDNGTVAKQAVLTVTVVGGSHGVGRFTATCAGAVDLAGNRQSAPVSVTYTVLYGMGKFLAPVPGSTVARSARVISVRFRLTDASDAPIPAANAAAIGAAHHVRVTLRGPGITAAAVLCGWNAAQHYFSCTIKIPAGVRTGAKNAYTITAGEYVGTGFVQVPSVVKGANPEIVHFR